MTAACLGISLQLIAAPVGAAAATVQLSNIFTALPSISDSELAPATIYAAAPGGHQGLLTLELEDDYDAVQIGVVNQFTSAWGIQRIALAPSASFGGDRAIGSAPYDLDGQTLPALLPVQWSQGGANSAPPGNTVLALATSAAAGAGQHLLPFASTVAPAFQGGASPAAGWYAADGLGCIPEGARITQVGPTSLSIDAALTAGGCGAGQAIYLSPDPFGPFAQGVPAAAKAGTITLLFSDWVALHSLPRSDGGFTLGGTVSGEGIVAGTTLAALDHLNLTLSRPLARTLPSHAPISITYAGSLAAKAEAGATTLVLNTAGGIRPGQTVLGSPAVPAQTHVAAVAGTQVTLDQPTTAPIAASTPLDFVNTTWSVGATASGSTLVPTVSTSGRPLLHIRFSMQPGSAPSVDRPQCIRWALSGNPLCEAPTGLPQWWTALGGQSQGGLPVDGIDFASAIGAGAGSPLGETWFPSFFIRFLGRHAGATVLICGGYQSAGTYGSVSSEAGPGRVGAAWASLADPSLPIAAVSLASRETSTDQDFANCTTMLDALQPSMVLIQDFSNHNNSSVTGYRAQVEKLAKHAQSLGTQPIIYVGYAEASANIGGLPVAGASHGTVVMLGTGVNKAVAGHNALVTGPGVASGTTGTIVPGGWHMTLSQPATIPAGAELRFVDQVGSVNGTSVLLAAPSYLSANGVYVQAPGVPANTTMNTRLNSTRATLSQPADIAPNTIPTLSVSKAASVAGYVGAAQWFYAATESWARVQLDGLGAAGTDPNNYGWLCDGCSTVGGYANEYGNRLIAAQFVSLLQRLTGQPADTGAR